jgi:hypothetical protein
MKLRATIILFVEKIVNEIDATGFPKRLFNCIDVVYLLPRPGFWPIVLQELLITRLSKPVHSVPVFAVPVSRLGSWIF